MRVLSCVGRSYYGDAVAVNPIYYYFVDVLRGMGHEVCHFDHRDQARWSKPSMNDAFISLVRGGRFDCVLVEAAADEFYPDALDEARNETTTIMFDSDDDFRWLKYSSRWAAHFTYVVTTYRHIYEEARRTHGNVLLSQWGCTGLYDGLRTRKDIDVSFVGGIHTSRMKRLRSLQASVPLEIYGAGASRADATVGSLVKIARHRISGGRGTRRALRSWVMSRLDARGGGLTYAEANELWCRSKVSVTPLDLAPEQAADKLSMAEVFGRPTDMQVNNPWGWPYQIKGRVFEMGTTGTLMLCDRNPMLDEYYVRGREYDDFEDHSECVEKVRFYVKRQDARYRIAAAYHERTVREHLWTHRFARLFSEAGLS